jgi:hypothetical protein
MAEKRTTDINLPLPPGEKPDPTIPGRLQRQNDVALQKTSRAYETSPVTRDPDATSFNPLKRLASKVNDLGRQSPSMSMGSSRRMSRGRR